MLASGFVVCKEPLHGTYAATHRAGYAQDKLTVDRMELIPVEIDPRDLRKARVVLDVSLVMSSLMPTEERNRAPDPQEGMTTRPCS